MPNFKKIDWKPGHQWATHPMLMENSIIIIIAKLSLNSTQLQLKLRLRLALFPAIPAPQLNLNSTRLNLSTKYWAWHFSAQASLNYLFRPFLIRLKHMIPNMTRRADMLVSTQLSYCQAQLSPSCSPSGQLQPSWLSFSLILHFIHPPPPVPVDSKLQLGKASSSSSSLVNSPSSWVSTS